MPDVRAEIRDGIFRALPAETPGVVHVPEGLEIVAGKGIQHSAEPFGIGINAAGLDYDCDARSLRVGDDRLRKAGDGRVLTVAFRLPALDRDLGNWHALNETRKRRLAELLTLLCDGDEAAWTGGARHLGDAPLLFRTGRAADGTRLWLAMPIGLDPVEEIPLSISDPAANQPSCAAAYLRRSVRIERLAPDGSWRGADTATPAPGRLDLRLRLLPAEPALLRLA